MDESSDQTLLNALLRGHEGAQLRLFWTYGSKIYSLAEKVNPNLDKELIACAVLLQIKQDAPKLAQKAKTSLLEEITRVTLEYAKGIRYQSWGVKYVTLTFAKAALLEWTEAESPHCAQDRDWAICFHLALEDLPLQERQVMALVVKGFKNLEIAQQLEVSVSTVTQRRKSAEAKIKSLLQE